MTSTSFLGPFNTQHPFKIPLKMRPLVAMTPPPSVHFGRVPYIEPSQWMLCQDTCLISGTRIVGNQTKQALSDWISPKTLQINGRNPENLSRKTATSFLKEKQTLFETTPVLTLQNGSPCSWNAKASGSAPSSKASWSSSGAPSNSRPFIVPSSCGFGKEPLPFFGCYKHL